MKSLTKNTLALLASYAFLMSGVVIAQDATPTPTATPTEDTEHSDPTLVYRGIAGYADKKGRDPTLSVGIVRETGVVKILADASEEDDLAAFPIKFEFYINRHLNATQIRSPELPGPIGIDVTPDIAVPPFNYAVVATLVHPNRQYTTVIYGAVDVTDLSATLDCKLTVESTDTTTEETTTQIYSASAVPVTQSGSNSFSLSFSNAPNEDATENASLSGTITLTGDANGEEPLSGNLDIDANGTKETAEVTGTATVSNGALTSFTAANTDESISLACE